MLVESLIKNWNLKAKYLKFDLQLWWYSFEIVKAHALQLSTNLIVFLIFWIKPHKQTLKKDTFLSLHKQLIVEYFTTRNTIDANIVENELKNQLWIQLLFYFRFICLYEADRRCHLTGSQNCADNLYFAFEISMSCIKYRHNCIQFDVCNAFCLCDTVVWMLLCGNKFKLHRSRSV